MPYKQTTYETCLACCLLNASTKKITKKLELECINHSMNFSKDDFVSGHTDFVEKKFNVSIKRYVGFPGYARFLRNKKLANPTVAKITRSFLDSLIDAKPIVLIDTKVLDAPIHYPHWIVIRSKKKTTYEIYDPWDGKIKNVPAKALGEGIRLLHEHLLMSTQLLVVTKN